MTSVKIAHGGNEADGFSSAAMVPQTLLHGGDRCNDLHMSSPAVFRLVARWYNRCSAKAQYAGRDTLNLLAFPAVQGIKAFAHAKYAWLPFRLASYKINSSELSFDHRQDGNGLTRT
jgi:hypothetical protein